jgi:hypothetical protein
MWVVLRRERFPIFEQRRVTEEKTKDFVRNLGQIGKSHNTREEL